MRERCVFYRLSRNSLHGNTNDRYRQAIGKFRELCKQFAEIGAPYLFTQIGVRFSRKDLQNLERLAGWKHLARHVKRFTYLVPYFFESGEFEGGEFLQTSDYQDSPSSSPQILTI